MINSKNIRHQLAFAAVTCFMIAGIVLTSCQEDNMDDHFGWNGNGETRNLMEVMESEPDLSQFCQVVKDKGLDSLLTSDQTFTVWAPTNEAMNGYTENTLTVDQFLKNHISRFVYGTSDLMDTADVRVKMLNGKFQDYAVAASGYTFAGVAQTADDKAAANGLIHIVGQRIPFYLNMYENIKQTDNNTDSLARFLKSFDVYTFNQGASTAVGKNSLGKLVYDSVFVYRNNWMRHYGYIYLEDSLYTMITPTNTGWQKAYNSVSKYFRTFGRCKSSSVSATYVPTRVYATSDTLADSLTHAYTMQNICRDLVFRGKVDPSNAVGDSLVSTGGNSFHHPASLFSGAVKETVSNGIMYRTDYWNCSPYDSYYKRIRVEAENTADRTDAYASVFSRSASNTVFSDSVSGMKYIEVDPSTTSARTQPIIQFTLPNTLAAKYDVYCIFAPANAYMADVAVDSTRVNFYLNYVHADGKMYEDKVISGGITHGRTMTKMYVGRVEFPFSNYSLSPFSGNETQDDDCVKLRVQTNVATSETTKLSRIMRIDCILLEPVNE
jgi:hypothetical protein